MSVSNILAQEGCADLVEAHPTVPSFKSLYKSTGECCGKTVSFNYNSLVPATGTNYYHKNKQNSISFKQDKPFREYACLWAETFGGVKLSKRIDFEVCGTEEAFITGPTSITYPLIYHAQDQMINGETFVTTIIESVKNKFYTDSTVT